MASICWIWMEWSSKHWFFLRVRVKWVDFRSWGILLFVGLRRAISEFLRLENRLNNRDNRGDLRTLNRWLEIFVTVRSMQVVKRSELFPTASLLLVHRLTIVSTFMILILIVLWITTWVTTIFLLRLLGTKSKWDILVFRCKLQKRRFQRERRRKKTRVKRILSKKMSKTLSHQIDNFWLSSTLTKLELSLKINLC